MSVSRSHYLQLAQVLPGETTIEGTLAPPSIDDLEPLLTLAVEQKVLPALGHPDAIRTLDLPTELASDLTAIFAGNTRRNIDLRNQAIEAIRALNQEGIAPLLLKGGAAMLDGIYKVPGALITSDIDVVVPEEDLLRSLQALLRAGFEETKPFRSNRHHIPPLLHRRTQTILELHRWIMRRGTDRLLPASEYWARTQMRTNPETGSYQVLDPTDALVHSIVHCQLHHVAYLCRSVRMKNLYDFALIARQHEGSIDWDRVQNCSRVPLQTKAARWHMALTRELFPWSGVPAVADEDPFRRLKPNMRPEARSSYCRQMKLISTLIFEPDFACGHYFGRLFSASRWRRTFSEVSALVRYAGSSAANRN